MHEKVVEKIIIFLNFGGTKIIIFLKFRGDQHHHFFKISGGLKSSFFEKLSKSLFFRKCVRMSQNGHFFSKNVEKMSPQNHENCVLLRKNTFLGK